MKYFVKKHNNVLHPTVETFDKLKEDKEYIVEIKSPRNVAFHRKFWGLLHKLYEAVHPDYTIEAMREILTIKAGYYERAVTKKGVHYSAKSISFGKMDEPEFNDFYNAINIAMSNEYGINLEDIEHLN